MNLLEAVKSGKRFRKPGGAWLERNNSGGLIARLPGGAAFEARFGVEDFELETWELEPEKKGPSPLERIEEAFAVIREAVKELVTNGETHKNGHCVHCGMFKGHGHSDGCVFKGTREN